MAHHRHYEINVTTGDKLYALQQSRADMMAIDRLSTITTKICKRITLTDV